MLSCILAVAVIAEGFLLLGCSSESRAHPSMSSAPAARAAESSRGRSYGEGLSPVVSEAAVGFDPTLTKEDTPPPSFATDELWVIQRTPPSSEQTQVAEDDVPPSGALFCPPPESAPEGSRIVPVPLEHTDVRASIAGYISTVNVTQRFVNPFSSKIEAVYVFPMPENAAVSDFVMTIGTRTIRGIIREREEAQRIYAAARSQGYVASLLTQERPNVFTQKVANIEPGHRIDIQITYYNTLAYSNGAYHFVFPMVVGPRFNPPASRAPILAEPAGTPLGKDVAVKYFRPRERSGADIAIDVDINAGVAIERIGSPTHQVETTRTGNNTARVRLVRSDSIPNKDFVLSYAVAATDLKSALITHEDRRGGYFTLMLVPPANLSTLDRSPVEIVYVVDRSGSMQGQPIAQAKDAVLAGLDRLREDDTFQIIDFSESASSLGQAPLTATPENLSRGRRYAQRLDAGGGTMMLNGLRAALEFPHDPRRLRFVAFLTDGFIGNETEILGELDRGLGDSRVFGMGVGSSPNRWLMDEMSVLGRGAVSYLGLKDDAGRAMDTFFETIAHPALTNLRIDWGDVRVSEVYPARLPDLFVGRPVIITGRYDGSFSRPIKVSGNVGTRRREIMIDPDAALAKPGSDAAASLPKLWARAKIADCTRRGFRSPNAESDDDIRRTALDYAVMSRFTAFLAVDSMTRTAGDHGTTVAVPVPVPEGTRYDTTVVEK
ncbi:MAG: VWA domain-containing protein [Planctomycetes bacterium]|nr:VWA domain-containing protein [Planctomycetota bacterium]